MAQPLKEQIITEGDDNRITEVIVFAQQAYLKREATAQTECGLNRFYIELTAFAVDSNSVQATVYGNGEILSVQYKEIPLLEKDIKQDDIRLLKNQQRELEQQRRVLKYKQENCVKQKSFLDSAVNLSTLQLQSPVEFRSHFPQPKYLKETLNNTQEMLALLSQNYLAIVQQEEEIITELQTVNEQLKLVQTQLTNIAPQTAKNYKTIEVLFDTKTPELIKIELFYVAFHATWKPVYKVDVNTDSNQMNITMFAHIEQATGENWQGVQLAVSNSAPASAGKKLPELDSWKIRAIYQAPTSKKQAQTKKPSAKSSEVEDRDTFYCGGDSSFLSDDSDYDAFEVDQDEVDPISEADVYLAYGRYQQAEELMRQAIAEHPGNAEYKAKLAEILQASGQDVQKNIHNPAPKKEAQFTQAQQIKSSLAFEYQLPVSIDMPSGNGETLLPLFTHHLKSEFFYYSVPKKESTVYLVCEADLESSFLPGPLNIHIGGRFVGSTVLTEKKAGQTLLVNLGAVHDIKIERKKVTDELAESFLGGMMDRLSIARKLEFRIVVENLKETPVCIKIIDAIPISNTDRIQVKNITLKPEAGLKDLQHRKGLMQWTLNVLAKETQDIAIQFFIKHPKDYIPELSH